MAVIDSLGFAVDTSDLKRAQVELRQTGNSAAKAADKSEKSMGKFRRTLGGVRSAVFSLQGAIGALGVGLVFREVLQANEAWTQQTNALKLVTSSAQELAQVQGELFELAQRTRGATSGTVDLYARLARSTKDLGVEQETLMTVTEAVNKSIAISGSSAESANAAIFQLGQGLAAGALRGEELNSVMEQTPRLAQALAEGLGVGIGQLRTLGEEGKLTAERVIAALTNQSDVIAQEFDQTTKTVSQATTQLANEIERTLGSIDNQGLISSLDSLRETLSDPAVIQGIQTLAQGLITAAEHAIKLASAVSDLAKFSGEALGEAIYGPINKEATQAIALTREQDEKVKALTSTLDAYIANRERLAQSGADEATLTAFDMQIERQQTLLEREKERLAVMRGVTMEAQAQAGTGGGGTATGGTGGGGGGTGGPISLEEPDEKLQEKLQKRFETLQQSYMSEQELALQAFNERTALIEELEQNKIASEQERRALSLESYAQYEADLTAIEEDAAKKRAAIAEAEMQSRLSTASTALGQLSTLMISKNKQMFEVGKKAAIAQTIIDTYSSAQKSYDALAGIPYVGPFLGAAAAAAAIAAGTARVNAIKSQSFSGGGGVSGAGGSGGVSVGGGQPVSASAPAAQATPPEIPEREVSIVVSGGLHSDDDVRNLIERVNEVNADLGGNAKLVAQ